MVVSNIITPTEYETAIDRAIVAKVESLTEEQNARYRHVMARIRARKEAGPEAMMTRAGIEEDVRLILEGGVTLIGGDVSPIQSGRKPRPKLGN